MIGTVFLGLAIICKWGDKITLKTKHWCALWLVMTVQSIVTAMIIRETIPYQCAGKAGLIEKWYFSLSVFGGCLLLACITDLYRCQVYNFVWWVAVFSQAFWLWRRAGAWGNATVAASGMGIGQKNLTELSVYIICQLLLGGRIYGKADAYAFSVCAMACMCFGMGLPYFMGQMLIAYSILFIVQLLKRNINGRGNLKRPVPFLPYITFSFWCTLILGCFSLKKVLY